MENRIYIFRRKFCNNLEMHLIEISFIYENIYHSIRSGSLIKILFILQIIFFLDF